MKTNVIFRVLVTLLAAIAIEAQPAAPPPNAAALREAKRVATAIFLDNERSDQERLSALPRMGYPEAETVPALLAVGVDRKESDTIRREALRRVPGRDLFIDAALKILDNPNDGGVELDAGLIEDLTKRVTFRPTAELRRRMTAVLRKLLTDRRDAVRLNAFRALVGNHDQVAVNLLADSLRRGRNFPIPLDEAIKLLDQDGPANHLSALRPYLRHSDPKVQAAAARALGLDPESRSTLVALATSVEAPQEVRVNALRALAREDEKFPSYALPIVESQRENGDIRYAAMHAFAGRMNYQTVDDADQVRFAIAVEKIAGDLELRSNNARKIREEARKLLEYLKKNFPAVERHYAGR